MIQSGMPIFRACPPGRSGHLLRRGRDSEVLPKRRSPMETRSEVAIIGGGIGGLTLAVALAQRGIECEVLEAANRRREQGAGLLLAPNALAILQRLGLYQRLQQQGYQPSKLSVTRADGRVLQQTDAAEWRERYGFAPLAIERRELL